MQEPKSTPAPTVGAVADWTYAKAVPQRQRGHVYEVYFYVQIRSVFGIDTVKQQFSAELYYRAAWREPRIASDYEGPLTFKKDEKEKRQVWDPQITFNAVEKVVVIREMLRTCPKTWVRTLPGEGGIVEYGATIHGKFWCQFDLSDFPYDTQLLKISIGSSSTHAATYKFLEDRMDGCSSRIINKHLQDSDFEILAIPLWKNEEDFQPMVVEPSWKKGSVVKVNAFPATYEFEYASDKKGILKSASDKRVNNLTLAVVRYLKETTVAVHGVLSVKGTVKTCHANGEEYDVVDTKRKIYKCVPKTSLLPVEEGSSSTLLEEGTEVLMHVRYEKHTTGTVKTCLENDAEYDVVVEANGSIHREIPRKWLSPVVQGTEVIEGTRVVMQEPSGERRTGKVIWCHESASTYDVEVEGTLHEHVLKTSLSPVEKTKLEVLVGTYSPRLRAGCTDFINNQGAKVKVLEVELKAKRVLAHYHSRILLPCVLITLMEMAALLYYNPGSDRTNYEARRDITMTLAFTLVAYTWQVAGDLPRLKHLTTCDCWVLGSLVLLVLAYWQHFLVARVGRVKGNLTKKRLRLAERIDFWTKIALLILFVLIYTIHFWRPAKKAPVRF
ncbi:hypothetical protein CTAYLR_003995 [Chrysophaeum taylorii]|uniref:Neurotransmitter-gated ion-channel ligand-binding domain-containing protein n=1 Tax=Chrysophaeum taylorii TaxID=2483200 RepID=A0AAD7XKV1_9STRA|nr:hypothetical protein CTAYLR_003995 [Chrysophaeum taylorii]